MKMKNCAYSEEYKRYVESYQPLFSADNFHTDTRYFQPVRHLIDGYVLYVDGYKRERPFWTGIECRLVDGDGETVVQWRSIHGKYDCTIIEHSNGKLYLIVFHDLPGYSVIDTEAKTIMQYLPECSLALGACNPKRKPFHCVTFRYNPNNNLMAVRVATGSSALYLFDFENPMAENKKYIDITPYLRDEVFAIYDVHDDEELAELCLSYIFVKWDGNDMCIHAHDVMFGCSYGPDDWHREEGAILVKEERYLEWMLTDENWQ